MSDLPFPKDLPPAGDRLGADDAHVVEFDGSMAGPVASERQVGVKSAHPVVKVAGHHMTSMTFRHPKRCIDKLAILPITIYVTKIHKNQFKVEFASRRSLSDWFAFEGRIM
ncbi:MAG TPA: hypothetical protein VNR39_12675 [Pseudolabrys sp.]|nr:hypothetical protein [Pseudolabrys sp.]